MISREKLDAIPVLTKFVVIDSAKQKHRCIKEKDGNIFIFAKGRSRYGYRCSEERFLTCDYKLQEKTDENVLWHKRIKKAKKALESSGLWADHLPWLENLEKMTWEDKEAINKLYWAWDNHINSVTPEVIESMKEHFGSFVEKYPFIFTDEGVNTWYLWEQSDVKLKAMNFGHWNQHYKREIQNALEEKRKYSTGRVIVTYDNSFAYDPEKNMAWYSEEYRNCGNGYYYLALDGNTALFCEKD